MVLEISFWVEEQGLGSFEVLYKTWVQKKIFSHIDNINNIQCSKLMVVELHFESRIKVLKVSKYFIKLSCSKKIFSNIDNINNIQSSKFPTLWSTASISLNLLVFSQNRCIKLLQIVAESEISLEGSIASNYALFSIRSKQGRSGSVSCRSRRSSCWRIPLREEHQHAGVWARTARRQAGPQRTGGSSWRRLLNGPKIR